MSQTVYFFITVQKYLTPSEKAGLKLNSEKTDPVPSSPITSWQIEGERVEIVTDFLFLGSKITVDGDYRHEMKRCLLLGRKAMTNLNSVLKSKDIVLLTKVYIVKAMVFLVVIYGCETWTIKKAESRRIDAFELWCWRRLLRVPWIARRSGVLRSTGSQRVRHDLATEQRQGANVLQQLRGYRFNQMNGEDKYSLFIINCAEILYLEPFGC